MSTANIHKWTLLWGDPSNKTGINPQFEKNEDNEELTEKWEAAIKDIREKILDDVWESNSKVDRDHFLKVVAKKQSHLYKPAAMRKLVAESLSK